MDRSAVEISIECKGDGFYCLRKGDVIEQSVGSTEHKAHFVGAYYQVIDAYCEPKPDPLPPIMVGVFRPKMLSLAARYADGWNVSSTGIRRYRRLAEGFERACIEVERDPATIQRSWKWDTTQTMLADH